VSGDMAVFAETDVSKPVDIGALVRLPGFLSR
jgi:hypothetical protein